MPKIDPLLARIQNDLFDLGSDLATPGADPPGTPPSLRITAAQTDWLEQQIDHYNEGLEAADELRPARRHAARGGAPRRPHRDAPRRAAGGRADRPAEPDINTDVLIYLNRLSDLLFVLARVANANGEADVLWVPGQYSRDPASSAAERGVMFLPLHDRNPIRHIKFPYVTYGLIALNVIVFLIQLAHAAAAAFDAVRASASA